MSATVIRVGNFRDHEQSLRDVRGTRRLEEVLASLKTTLTGPGVPALAARLRTAAEVVDDVVRELEVATKGLRIDRRGRSPRALAQLLRETKNAAARIRHASQALDV